MTTTRTTAPADLDGARRTVMHLAQFAADGDAATRREFIAVAKAAGLTGRGGGWIYVPGHGRIAQGWAAFARVLAAGWYPYIVKRMAWHLLSADAVRDEAESEGEVRARIAQSVAWDLAHGLVTGGGRYITDSAYDAAVEADHAEALATNAAWDALESDAAGHPVAFEAACLECGETFNPLDEDDTVHVARSDGELCGGIGEMLAAWL